MKNQTSFLISNHRRLLAATRTHLVALIAIFCLIAAFKAQAASSTWTNAPVDGAWTNVNNWNSKVVPGTINNVVNNGVDTSSIATFTNPIPVSLIGSASSPIIPDDGTVVGGANGGAKARMLYQLNFSGPTCGAYVFNTPSPYFAGATGGNPETGVLSLCIASSGAPNNGSYINSDVVNPQTFLIPVQIRLPSSTTGQYGFTNNAVSPLATYFFNNLFLYPGASGRGLTFVLSGSNTGTNTIALLSQSSAQLAGNLTALRKDGPGRWILSGANTFNVASVHNINDGTLEVQNAAAFGLGVATVNSNGVLQVDGVNLNASAITLQYSGKLIQNGSSTINGVTVGTAFAPTTPTVGTTGAGGVMTLGTAANKVTGGALSSVLHVSGPGTVLLSYANNYVGSWSVDSGTLQIAAGATGALGTGLNLNVGAGATLDVTPYTAGSVTYNPGPSGLGGSGTGTTAGSTAATILADPSGIIDLATGAKTINLTFTPTAFAGDLLHPALSVPQGTLNLGGNAFSINNASGTALGAGTYKLIACGNAITSTGGLSVIGVTGSGLVSGAVASIQVNGAEVDLVVSLYVSKNLVWSGTGTVWDLASTADWLNGASASVFNNSDSVIFNAVGNVSPAVTVNGTLAPGSVMVSNVVAYTLNGSGSIAGSASLTKAGSGTLTVSTVNTYGGGTLATNGVLQLGVNNALPANGAGDVTVQSPAILDLNTYSDTINALIGNGTVDSVLGGTPVLTIGNNNDNGAFSGVIKNTTGTLGLTKAGNGLQTLSGANTYAGPTVINAGTLRVNNYNALGSGGSAVTVNTSSTLDMQTSVLVNSLSGSGTVANNSSGTANTLAVTNSSTFNGIIADGSGGGSVGVLVASGALVLNGNNTYTGGTILAQGTTLGIGQAPGQPGTSGVIASNGVTINATSHGSTACSFGNQFTTVDGATVTFTSGSTLANGTIANNIYGQFVGSANATNIFFGNMSLGGALSFSNFNGTAIFTNAGTRLFNAVCGGDNTTFMLQGTGGFFTRDPDTMHVGALFGNGVIYGPTTGPGTYLIGGKNINSQFEGTIGFSNNIVKIGTGTLTLDGQTALVVSSPDGGLTYETNSEYANTLITYTGYTTISNGVLKLVAPIVLTNSSSITLSAATAVLDASQMGFIDTDGSTYTNLVTNGVFEVVSGQTLSGIGTIQASNVLLDAGSILNVGQPTGVLTASQKAELAGAVNFSLAGTSSGKLTSPSIVVDGTATLVVTNTGGLINGTTFTLFSQPVSGFASLTLPITDPVTAGTYVWQTNLDSAGTITLVSGGSTPYTLVYNGNGNTGGTVPVDPNSPYASGATVTVLDNTGSLTKTGYAFAGWNTAADGSGTAYAATSTFLITANTTLYAQWTASVVTPPTLGVVHSGNTLTFNWTGAFTLQAQTNALNVGLKTNSSLWFNTGVNSGGSITIDPANPTVFFRLSQ